MRSFAITFLAAALVSMAARGDDTNAMSEPASGVRILWQQARWATLGGPDELGNAGDSVFVISGELRNASGRSIWSVKLHYDLLDELHGRVASEYGFNRGAEDLRRADYESGAVGRAALDVQPLAPGAVDLFRMVFFRREVPPFAHWRVRIGDVEYAGEPESPPR